MSKIKLGLITDVVPLGEIAEGWDYYEIPSALHCVPLESEANWVTRLGAYRARGVPVLVASHYIHEFGTAASGPSYDREQQVFWAQRSFRRLNEVGVKVVGVYGGFFRCPDGYGRSKAVDDAVSFCNIIADEAERYGMQIALEPMAEPDTLFPTYKEGLAFAKATGRRSVRVMADLNYFLKINQSLEDIREDPSCCLHVHMAGEGHGDSAQPNIGPRTEAFKKLFSVLRDIDYSGTVSAACAWVSSTGSKEVDYKYETAVTLKYMRDLAE
jgi:sugar phosphate isomerase/epimerase